MKRRESFVAAAVLDAEAIEQATRLFNSAKAWADANELEEVMFR